MISKLAVSMGLALILSIPAVYAEDGGATPPANDQGTYDRPTIVRKAERFFGKGAKGLAEVIEKAFDERGQPNGYIEGEEAGGAIGVGVRYGKGMLYLKGGAQRQVYWQGPSVGFDIGANAAKVFVLVYDLPRVEQIFQRYPGVEGSLYFVAGAGLNYVQNGDVVLAPIRVGVGWRQGANVGYMHFTKEQSWIPF